MTPLPTSAGLTLARTDSFIFAKLLFILIIIHKSFNYPKHVFLEFGLHDEGRVRDVFVQEVLDPWLLLVRKPPLEVNPPRHHHPHQL